MTLSYLKIRAIADSVFNIEKILQSIRNKGFNIDLSEVYDVINSIRKIIGSRKPNLKELADQTSLFNKKVNKCLNNEIRKKTSKESLDDIKASLDIIASALEPTPLTSTVKSEPTEIIIEDYFTPLASRFSEAEEKGEDEYMLVDSSNISENYTDSSELWMTNNELHFLENNKKRLISEGYILLAKICDHGLTSEEINTYNLFKKLNFESIRRKTANKLIAENDVLRMNYLAAIICVMWALNDYNEKTSNKFERGSCKTTDTKIFEFLVGYYEVANKEKLFGIVPYSGLFYAANNMIYTRDPKLMLSSHYKKDHKQHGIDVRFDADDNCSFILPNNWSHILFGEIDSNYPCTFFKLEQFGMGDRKQALNHASEFLHGKHISPDDRREKDLPAGLKKSYVEFCKYSELTNECNTVKDIFDQANDYLAHGFPENMPSETKTKIIELFHEMELCVANDKYLHIRHGKEVIIDTHDLTLVALQFVANQRYRKQ